MKPNSDDKIYKKIELHKKIEKLKKLDPDYFFFFLSVGAFYSKISIFFLKDDAFRLDVKCIRFFLCNLVPMTFGTNSFNSNRKIHIHCCNK